MEWLKQQGPWCPALIEYLRRHQQQYDVLIFFTYLYAPTVHGPGGEPRQEHARVDGARRAGHQAGDLQGRLQPAGGALLPDRQRTASSCRSSFPSGRCSRRSSASASTCRSSSPIRGCRRRSEDDAARRESDTRRERDAPADDEPPAREFPSHLHEPRLGVPPPASPARPDRRCTAAASIPARAARS